MAPSRRPRRTGPTAARKAAPAPQQATGGPVLEAAPSASPVPGPTALRALQRALGNRAVGRLLGPPGRGAARALAAPQIQRAPQKSTKRGAGLSDYFDPFYKPALELTYDSSQGCYYIKGTAQRLYWQGKGYSADPAGRKSVDVQAYLKTATPEFTEWTGEFKEVAAAQERMGDADLKRALSMHVLQKFYSNALYTAEEIANLNYQTTPLNYQSHGAYLRTRATAFVQALRDTFKGYEKADLFLVRNLDFNQALGQIFHRIDASAAKDAGTIKAALKADIARIVDFAVKNGNLAKFGDTPDYRMTFMDFSKLLEGLTNPDEVNKRASDYAQRVNQAAYEEAMPLMVDRYVDEYYTDYPGDKAGLKAEIQKFVKGSRYDLKVFYDYLDQRERAAFPKAKGERVAAAQQAIAAHGAKLSKPGELYTQFAGELRGYKDYLQGMKNSGARLPKTDFEFLRSKPGSSNELDLFQQLIAEPNGSFKQYLGAREQRAQTETYVPLTRDKATLERELQPILDLKTELPTVIFSGGTLTIQDQPTLLLGPQTAKNLRGLVSFTLNKTGYVPTPTSASKKLLKNMSLQQVVAAVLERQIAMNVRDVAVTNKLNKILAEVKSFDPAKHPTLAPVANQLKQTKDAFTEFAKLVTSKTDYVNILAGSAAKLIEALKLLDAGSPLPELAQRELEANLKAAVRDQAAIASFVRDIQNIHELIILTLERNPAQANLSGFAFPAPKEGQQDAHITDYGLKAFTQAYNAFLAQNKGKTDLSIDSFYNIYFELSEKLSKTQQASGGSITLRKPEDLAAFKQLHKTADVKAPRPDLILIDIHPNDAARTVMHQHNILELIKELLPEGEKNMCTLIVDVTLNHVAEQEIADIQAGAKPYIDAGRLNLVVIQSMTKFPQFGMDKQSGGLMLTYNKPDVWKAFNDSVQQSTKADVVDPTIESYFKLLFQYTRDEQLAYIKKVRANTRKVYDRFKSEVAKRGMKDSAISIAENDDPGTCYVAFHYEEFASKVFGVDVTDKDVERLNLDVLNRAIYELMAKLKLPMSMRMSFGFPISNLGDTGKTIRLTVGIEEEAMLNEYVDVITYVNAQLTKASPDLLREKDSRQTFLDSIVDKVATVNQLKSELDKLFPTI